MTTTIDWPRAYRSLGFSFALGFALAMGAWNGIAHAGSQAAPWCAAMGGQSSAWDCSYYTFEQCMATARGLSNMCAPNPRAQYLDERLRQRRSRR